MTKVSTKLIDFEPVETLPGNTRRSPWGCDHHWGRTSEAFNIQPESNQLWRPQICGWGFKILARGANTWAASLASRYWMRYPRAEWSWSTSCIRFSWRNVMCSPKWFWPWWFWTAYSSACLGSRIRLPVPDPLPPPFFHSQPQNRRGAPSCRRLPTLALLQGGQEQVFHFDFLYPFSLSDAARKTCLIIQPLRGNIGRSGEETCYCRESFCCANQLWRCSTTCATASQLVVFLILTIELSNQKWWYSWTWDRLYKVVYIAPSGALHLTMRH